MLSQIGSTWRNPMEQIRFFCKTLTEYKLLYVYKVLLSSRKFLFQNTHEINIWSSSAGNGNVVVIITDWAGVPFKWSRGIPQIAERMNIVKVPYCSSLIAITELVASYTTFIVLAIVLWYGSRKCLHLSLDDKGFLKMKEKKLNQRRMLMILLKNMQFSTLQLTGQTTYSATHLVVVYLVEICRKLVHISTF